MIYPRDLPVVPLSSALSMVGLAEHSVVTTSPTPSLRVVSPLSIASLPSQENSGRGLVVAPQAVEDG